MPPADRPQQKETLEDRITAAISNAFTVNLGQQRAIQQEMNNATREIVSRTEMMARHLADIAKATGANPAMREEMHRRTRAQAVTPLPAARRPQPLDVSPAALGAERPKPPSAPRYTTGELVKTSRSDIRDHVANWAADRAESWAARPMNGVGMLYEDPVTGRTMATTTEGVYPDALGRLHGPDGKFVKVSENLEDGDSIATKSLRRAVAAKGAMTVARNWQAGQPFGRALFNALPQGALRAAGGVGLAFTAYQGGLGLIRDQAAQNRVFQRAYGGSQWDAMGERWNRFTNRISHDLNPFNLLGGGAYDALFEQAMGLGLRGRDRGAYISAGAAMINKGATEDQVQQILSTALATGQTLNGLAGAISKVGSAAREAGVNAEQARTVFAQNYQMSSQLLIGASGGAKDLATGLTIASTQLGHAYAGVQYGGMFSTQLRYSIAAQNGMAPTDVLRMGRSDPASVVGMGEEALKRQLSNMTGGKSGAPSIPEIVRMWIDNNGGMENFIPERDVIFIGQAIEDAGYDRARLVPVLQQYGVALEHESQAPGLVARLFIPGLSPSDSVRRVSQERLAQMGPNAGRDVINVGERAFIDFGVPASVLDMSKQLGVGRSWVPSVLKAVSNYDGSNTASVTFDSEMSSVLGTLLKDAPNLGLDPEKTKVVVRTKDGNRVVSFAEAIEKFQDQIQAGTAFILEGASESTVRRSVADIVGMTPEIQAQQPKASSMNDPALADVGEPYSGIDGATKPKDKEGSSTEVRVTVAPEVASWMRAYVVNGSGGSLDQSTWDRNNPLPGVMVP